MIKKYVIITLEFLFFCWFVMCLIFPCSAYAVTAWVDDNGAASWGSCQGASPLSGAAACSLSTANSNATAGDVINFRAGDYSTTISPTNSGTSGNPITWQAYNSEVVNLTNASYGIYLVNDDWHIFDGFTRHQGGYYVFAPNVSEDNDSDHIVVKNCDFKGNDNYSGIGLIFVADWEICYNTFGPGDLDGSGGGPLVISRSTRIYIHDNTFADCGNHTCIGFGDSGGGVTYSIIKDNTFYNSGVFTDVYESVDTFVGMVKENNYIVVEGNTFYESGANINDNHTAAVKNQRGNHHIVRRNKIYNIDQFGYQIYGTDNGTSDAEYNCVYNNSFYNVDGQPEESYQGVVTMNRGTGSDVGTIRYNQVLNNIIHTGSRAFSHYDDQSAAVVQNNQVWRGNHLYNLTLSDEVMRQFATMTIAEAHSNYASEYYDNTGNDTTDPLFIDPPSDMALQSGSLCINTGKWLTTITSANGSGTSFTVELAAFFHDGYGISGVTGDVIKTASGQTATIKDITGNTITVKSTISWTQNEGLALYFEGIAPDIGAYEYEEENNAPVCVIDTPSSPYSVNSGTYFDQQITATCTDADNDSLTFQWTFDDGFMAEWDEELPYVVDDLVIESSVYYKATSDSEDESPPSQSYWNDYADQLEDPGRPYSGPNSGVYQACIVANDGEIDSQLACLTVINGSPYPTITYQSTILADGAYNDDDGNITAISTHFTESVTVTSVPQQIVFLSNNSTAYPNDISHANWVKTRATVASGQKYFEEWTTLSNCGAIVASVDDNTHNIRSEYVAATEGDTYVMDVWLSEGALDWARIMLAQYESDYSWSSGQYCDVDIANKTVGTCSSGVYGAYYGEDSDGWVHFSIMATITDATPDVAYVAATIFPAEADTDIVFIGDASSNYTYVCGAEIYKRIALLDYSSGSPSADLVWANHTIANGDNIDRLDLGPIYFEGTDAIESTSESLSIDQSVIYSSSLRGRHNIRIDTDHPSPVGVNNTCNNCTSDGNITSQGLVCIEIDWDENLECDETPVSFTLSTSGMKPSDIIGYNWGFGDDESKRVICFNLNDKYRIGDFATATSLSVSTACTDAAGNAFESTGLDNIADSAAINVAIPGHWTVCASQCDETDIANIDTVSDDFILDFTNDGDSQSFDGDNLVIRCMIAKTGTPGTWTFTGSNAITFNCERKGMTISGANDIGRSTAGFLGY